MHDKNRPQGSTPTKPDVPKGQGTPPNPGVGQKIPDDQGKANKQGNAAGQSNEGDEVMPSWRETRG